MTLDWYSCDYLLRVTELVDLEFPTDVFHVPVRKKMLLLLQPLPLVFLSWMMKSQNRKFQTMEFLNCYIHESFS